VISSQQEKKEIWVKGFGVSCLRIASLFIEVIIFVI
jgi:hypothetical protein